MNTLWAAVSGNSDLMQYIVLGVAGGFAPIAAIYGLIRGFCRLTWIGWELLIAFGLDILVFYKGQNFNFAVSALLLVLFTALPLAGEYFLRRLTGRVREPRTGGKVFDRLFGMFTAIVGVLMFFVSVGGLGLAAAGAFADSVPEIPIVSDFALDFFLIAVCMVTIRAGCRLGVLKGLNYLLTVLLVFGAFFGCLLLFSQVGWGRSFSTAVGGWFGMSGSLAAIVGGACLTLFFTAILFAAIMILSRFLDGVIRKVNTRQAVAIPDALILGAVYTVVFVLIVLGIQAAFHMLAEGNFLSSLMGENVPDAIAEIERTLGDVGKNLEAFATSSPLSQGLYHGNPFFLQ